MKILAFEFSSPQRSVAVLHTDTPGQTIASAEVLERSPGNTMKPLAMTAEVLRQAGLERGEIECIAVGIGPGSYTGIRAGIALAQGWQLGREVKLLGISSVHCIAANAYAPGLRGNISVVVDAQKGELYVADYDLDRSPLHEKTPLRLASPLDVIDREKAGSFLVGPEILRWFPQGKQIFPTASVLAQLATSRTDFVTAEKLEPIYLRETTFVKASSSRAIPPL
jgi:tRNA threonylcarbamoyl adenosine modification protein YeaZ